MSGGVDSAVALLRSPSKAIGVTLRLWVDPAGWSRARLLFASSVIAARETCHRLGRPHVTLDLREFRRTVVRSSGATPGARRRTRAGAATAASVSTSCSRSPERRLLKLGTGHHASIVERDGLRLSPAVPMPPRTSRTCWRFVDPALPRRLWFPARRTGEPGARVPRPRPPGSPRLDRAESQEACFLAGGDYRTFLGATGLARRAGRSSTSKGS